MMQEQHEDKKYIFVQKYLTVIWLDVLSYVEKKKHKWYQS